MFCRNGLRAISFFFYYLIHSSKQRRHSCFPPIPIVSHSSSKVATDDPCPSCGFPFGAKIRSGRIPLRIVLIMPGPLLSPGSLGFLHLNYRQGFCLCFLRRFWSASSTSSAPTPEMRAMRPARRARERAVACSATFGICHIVPK